MAMMGVVLIDPPAPTPTNQQITHQETCDPALPAGAENLSMPNIMAEETKLHRNEAQVDRIQKLKPEIVDDEQESYSNDKEAQGKEYLIGIVGRLLIQQASLLHELLQLDIFI
jgi:hypothetical protein